MGNHFHFSIQIKSIELLKSLILKIEQCSWTSALKNFIETTDDLEIKLDKLIINQFQNFQNSYAKAVYLPDYASGNTWIDIKRATQMKIRASILSTGYISPKKCNCFVSFT